MKIYSTSYTERESCLGFEPPLRCAWASFYSSKGSPTGVNVEKGKNVTLVVVVIVREQCMNSGLHLTLTVGDKGIKCPSPSPPKASVHASPFATAVALSPWLATVCPRLHSRLPRAPWKGPRATRGQMSWSAGTRRRFSRQAPCRGRDLAGPGSLSLFGSCRGV